MTTQEQIDELKQIARGGPFDATKAIRLLATTVAEMTTAAEKVAPPAVMETESQQQTADAPPRRKKADANT